MAAASCGDKSAALRAQTAAMLSEVYGFAADRCREAVDAVVAAGTPEDDLVAAAVDWLLDAGEVDKGGPTVPTQLCPHLRGLIRPCEARFSLSCSVPGCPQPQGENWLCAHCGYVACGRYAAKHALHHADEHPGHTVSVSLGCLAPWCYKCSAYVKHVKLEALVRQLELQKFSASSSAGAASMAEPAAEEIVLKVAFSYAKESERHEAPASASSLQRLEGPKRTRAAVAHLAEQALLAQCEIVAAREVSDAELLLAHSEAFLESYVATRTGGEAARKAFIAAHCHQDEGTALEVASSEGGAEAQALDLYLTPASEAANRASVGSLLAVLDAVLDDASPVAGGLALTRPPGHHSSRDGAGGFCLYNHCAVAAHAALARDGVGRVLILDLDVHHGNGTQSIFYEDPRVLVISIHAQQMMGCSDDGSAELGAFPDAGLADRCGSGAGEGFNVNVPLPYTPGGYGDEDYLAILQGLVLPISREFAPDVALVAAGFDACLGDPCGVGFRLTPAVFGACVHALRARGGVRGGRVAVCLEGGYLPDAVSRGLEGCASALLQDADSGAALGAGGGGAAAAATAVLPAAAAALEAARAAQARHWACCR